MATFDVDASGPDWRLAIERRDGVVVVTENAPLLKESAPRPDVKALHPNAHIDRAERYYADKLLPALRLGLDPKEIADGWMYGRLVRKGRKAALPDPAAQSYVEGLTIDTAALAEVLDLLYNDGYLAGAKLTATSLLGRGLTLQPNLAAFDSSFDWSTWEPGNVAAAELLRGVDGGGLRNLLDQADITIKSVADSRLEELAGALAKGAESGASADDIASEIAGILDNPDRAEMIATTELNRAVSAASLDSYGANGITRWDWLAEADACAECDDLAANGPYGLDADNPPAHPRCRCAASPHIDTEEEKSVKARTLELTLLSKMIERLDAPPTDERFSKALDALKAASERPINITVQPAEVHIHEGAVKVENHIDEGAVQVTHNAQSAGTTEIIGPDGTATTIRRS